MNAFKQRHLYLSIGRVPRTAAVVAVVVLVLLGGLIAQGYRAGYFGLALGLVLVTAVAMAGLGALILWNAGMLREANAPREQAGDERGPASQYARSLIEASLDPLVTISVDGKITDVNEATIRATGVSRDALLGSDFSNYFTEPDKARAGYQEAFVKGFVTDYPLSLRHISGRVREVLYNASVYRDERGEVAGVFAAARDITERKRAEGELRSASLYARSLIEASVDPLVTISADGKITDVNEATIHATGVPRETLVGSDFSEYFTEPDKARAGYQEVFARGFVTDYPLSLRHVSGRVREVLYNASVYRDERGEVAGVFAAARDVTELKQAERNIRERMKELRAFFHLSELSERKDFPLESLYQELAQVLPESWQHPEIACARIVINEREFRTDNFRVTGWMQEAPVRVFGSVIGKIEVGYLEQNPARDEGPFLKEERQLINAVAERVGHITERKRAEEEVRSTSLYVRSLIEANLDPLVTISAEGKITDVNEATIEATGIPREALIGSDFSNYFTEPDKARAGYQEVFAKGRVTDYPLSLRHVSGKVREVLYNASVYRNDKGEVAGVFAAARDITERKRAEARVRYLAAIVESSDDGIIGKTLDGVITSWNTGAEKMYGYTANEAVGQPMSILIPPGHQDELSRILGAIRAGQHVEHFETIRRKKNGEDIHVSLSISPISEAGGRIIGAATVARDITERKRAEAELSAASLYARSLIEANLDPLVTISAEGKITDVNEATIQVTGVPRKLLVGSDFSEYFTEPGKARAGYQEVFAKGFVTDYPLTLKHVSGKLTEVLYNASVYRNDKGEVAGVFAAARDITERKRAEAELSAASLYARSLIEASLDPLVTISAEGKVTDVNEATIRATGVAREALLGSDFSEYFTEPDQARAGYQEVFAKGFVTDYPLSLRHASGKVMEVLYNASVYRNDKGETAGVFAAARDITARKRAEEELHRYHEQLEELVRERTGALETANKDLEGFAYSVSHDLRVPLRAIDGFSHQVLKRYEDKLDDEGKRYLNVVRDNTKKMAQLIDDILAFSRMGRLGMTMSELDMEALARAVFEELKPGLAGRELAMEIKPLPPCHGDQAMLRQVWVNLLANAIKFTRPKAAARIEVGARAEGGENIYYVKDNGAGFDMQYADKLFGVFQRLHGVAEFEGTGIGLAIVKRIITRHGGRVWAEGKVDEGATFYFALPPPPGTQDRAD